MTTKLLVLLLSAVLGACALPSPPPPDARAIAPAPAAAPVPEPAAAPNDPIRELLDYQTALHSMDAADLARETDSVGASPATPANSLRGAIILMQSRAGGDLARAQGMLVDVLASTEDEAARIRPLARLLAAHCAQLRRMGEQADKLGAQLKETQRRNAQLNDMLEGLKAIERTLPSRPAAGTAGVGGSVGESAAGSAK